MWLSVSLLADAARAEALSDALMEHGALTVSIDDADAGTAAEQPQFGEPGHLPESLWARSRVVALFDPDDDIEACLADAARQVGLSPLPEFSVEYVAEQNWVQLTQSQFEPIHVTDGLWIVPSWHEAPDPRAVNIRLDPGMAFGTGSHPTTRLCLRWLMDTVRPGLSVLDYGCGSGILAIAAARFGGAPRQRKLRRIRYVGGNVVQHGQTQRLERKIARKRQKRDRQRDAAERMGQATPARSPDDHRRGAREKERHAGDQDGRAEDGQPRRHVDELKPRDGDSNGRNR